MSWIDFLERRFGRLAIPHLLRYVAMLNGLAFVLCQLRPGFINQLTLDPHRVQAGEVWRLLSHIFVPSVGGWFPDWISAAFYVLFLIWLGDGLEQAMGSFRLTLYYAMGVLGTTAASFLAGEGVGGLFLNNSLVFAFAFFFPDVRILFFFIIPLRIKWIAWLDVIFLVPTLLLSGWGYRFGAFVALANFLLFFGPAWVQARRLRGQIAVRKAAFEEAMDADGALHCCHLCGRTEMSAPDLVFRVAKDGNEYCKDHIPRSI